MAIAGVYMFKGDKLALLEADVRGCCLHIADPLRDPWFGRVWQGDGTAVFCQPCFAHTRLAVIAHLVEHHKKTQNEAEQYFADYSLLASEVDP